MADQLFFMAVKFEIVARITLVIEHKTFQKILKVVFYN